MAGCRFLPPYILRAIAARGTPTQGQRALTTLAADTTIRSFRAATATVPWPTRQALVTPEAHQRRTIFDGRHTETLPGKLLRSEGDPVVKDTAVNEAYDGLGATFAFYW